MSLHDSILIGELVNCQRTDSILILPSQSQIINDYIKEGMEMVQEVDSILSTIKGNVAATKTILKAWEKNVMFDRKEGKVRPPPSEAGLRGNTK